MPRYTFIDTNTNEEFYEYMSSDSKEQFLKDNPHIEQPLCTPGIGDSVRLGIRKPSTQYNEVIKKIDKALPINNLPRV